MSARKQMAGAKVLKVVEKRLDNRLKKQTQDGLATVFKELRCGAIARKIKAGRNVTGNTTMGFRLCVHDRLGPRYDPIKRKFSPMSANGKRIEKKFEENINGLLESGGFKPMPSSLISNLRKKDKAFEKSVKKRKK